MFLEKITNIVLNDFKLFIFTMKLLVLIFIIKLLGRPNMFKRTKNISLTFFFSPCYSLHVLFLKKCNR